MIKQKIVLLAKTKFNTTEVLIVKALIDSYIRHHEFVLVNNILREYDDMKVENRNPKASTVHQIS